MNGIKMSDCKFYVNEEERTVVCVIPTFLQNDEDRRRRTKDMLIGFIEDNFQFKDINVYDALGFWGGKFMKELEMPSSFIGKAVCSVDDEWNEETGRMIAFSRAKDKCYKSFFKRANLLIQTMDRRLNDMIEVFNDFGTKLETKRGMLEKQIEERVKEKEGDA